jgi:hypothetical protein
MPVSWPSESKSHSNRPSELDSDTYIYNSDFMDTLDQGYPYPTSNMDYLATPSRSGFMFDPTMAKGHSSQRDNLFLPPPTHAVDSFHSDSSNSVPDNEIRVPHNPNKRLRISDFTEENVLPDNERRKRSKPDRLIL